MEVSLTSILLIVSFVFFGFSFLILAGILLARKEAIFTVKRTTQINANVHELNAGSYDDAFIFCFPEMNPEDAAQLKRSLNDLGYYNVVVTNKNPSEIVKTKINLKVVENAVQPSNKQ